VKENTRRHNPKKKQKQIINKNKVKTYANKTHGYEMMINDNKRRPKTKELPFATYQLMTKVH
jgi:hypothetical protein